MSHICPWFILLLGLAINNPSLGTVFLVLIPEHINIGFPDQNHQFICILEDINEKATVQAYQWRINHQSYRSPFNLTIPCENQGTMNIVSYKVFGDSVSTLDLIQTPAGCNNTAIQCEVILKESKAVQSEESKLLLEGLLPPPSHVHAVFAKNMGLSAVTPRNLSLAAALSTKIALSWEAPFSHHVRAYANNGIHYEVIATTPSTGVETYSTPEEKLEINLDSNHPNCQAYTFNVTVINPVGRGGTSFLETEIQNPYCTVVELQLVVSYEDEWRIEFPMEWQVNTPILVIKPSTTQKDTLNFIRTNNNDTLFTFHGRQLAYNEVFNMNLSFIENNIQESCNMPTATLVNLSTCNILISIPILKNPPTEITTYLPIDGQTTDPTTEAGSTTLIMVTTEGKNSLKTITGGTVGASIVALAIPTIFLTSAVYVTWRHRRQPRYHPHWLLNLLSVGTIYCLRKLQQGATDLEDIAFPKSATTEF